MSQIQLAHEIFTQICNNSWRRYLVPILQTCRARHAHTMLVFECILHVDVSSKVYILALLWAEIPLIAEKASSWNDYKIDEETIIAGESKPS